MESSTSIEQFHEELQSWKHELSSIKQEIRHFEHELEEMARRKLPRTLLAQIEHFQNLFICHKEVIDTLRHDLPDSRQKVENIFNVLRSVKNESQHALSERMETFRKIFNDVKKEFGHFSSSMSLELAGV
jgi:chromosome segregation ATPase